MALRDFDFKKIASTLVLAYFVVTILNVLIHKAIPSVPVFSSGVALILIFISAILVLIFTFSYDGNFSKEDIQATLLIVALMIAIFFIIKHFIPELFSLLPQSTKEMFSIVP